MSKRILIIGFIFMLLVAIGVVAAQDATAEPPIENECSPGGTLYREENQDGCPTVWHWQAGYYLAQYNNGDLPLEDFPDEYAETLPSLDPTPPPSPPVIIDDGGILTICHYSAGTLSDHCLRADLTGTVISRVPESPTLFVHLIIPIPYTCPDMLNGHGRRGQGDVTAFYGAGFTDEEFAMLGFDSSYWQCEYNYLGNW